MVEQPAVNRRVAGSSPASGAIFPEEISKSGVTDTALTQKRPESVEPDIHLCQCEAEGHRGSRRGIHRGRGTAQPAGNSPVMPHQNYKGLATKKEGEAWFAMAPAQAANVSTLAATLEKKA
jgi:hypothetical protein